MGLTRRWFWVGEAWRGGPEEEEVFIFSVGRKTAVERVVDLIWKTRPRRVSQTHPPLFPSVQSGAGQLFFRSRGRLGRRQP